MARLNKVSESPAPNVYDDIYSATPEPTDVRNRTINTGNPSPSPGASDKENQAGRTAADKGKGRAVPLSRAGSGLSDSGSMNKRKRLEDDVSMAAPDQRRRRTIDIAEDNEDEIVEGYDPDQDINQRRQVRNKIRDLSKSLNDNRADYLNPNSTGIAETLQKANRYVEGVKQTSDATIDSRLLVTTADLSYRQTVQLTLGDSAQGVDVDEFVSKCITLMRRAGASTIDESIGPHSTQSRRRTRNANAGSGEDEGDEGDMLNWEALGNVASQNNSRPALPGFLLGPLSVEKRARKATQRKAGLKIQNLKETQPTVLTSNDIQKNENSNLTVLCSRIWTQLEKVQTEGADACEREIQETMSENEMRAVMDKHGLLDTGAADFFKFVINPYSFGQTIENMFYVSFLIRDGKVGISFNDQNLPGLEVTQARTRGDAREGGAAKHQAILDLDMASWKELIEVFDIKEPMIPHREEEVNRELGSRGWFS